LSSMPWVRHTQNVLQGSRKTIWNRQLITLNQPYSSTTVRIFLNSGRVFKVVWEICIRNELLVRSGIIWKDLFLLTKMPCRFSQGKHFRHNGLLLSVGWVMPILIV